MERALIIGCGYVGAVLAARLRTAGVAVEGTSASGGPGLQALDLSVDRPGGLQLPGAAGAVVYYMVSTLAQSYDPAARPHLLPLERCLEALAGQPLAGLIYLSSTSVYGDAGGAWVDETTPTAPRTPWGMMRVELEQRVQRYGADRGVPACVVRLPEIYGPGRGPVERLRQGHALRYPERYSNRIHVDDLGRILARLGERLDLELLLAADDEPATTRAVYQYAASLMGLGPVPELPPPDALTIDPNRLGLMQESKRCDNATLRGWLDGPLRYPTYREGIAALLAS